MQLYQVAAGTAAIFFLALCFMQVIIRNQVHRAKFGSKEIKPWDVRFGNSFLGPQGTWQLHKRAYKRSTLRSMFIVICAGLIASLLLLLILGISGCARPYKTDTFKSATAGVFYTVEMYNGGPGPLGTDTTRVYAHFERHGKSTKTPVLEGDLTVSDVIWTTPYDATICLKSGITDIFHNRVTLILGDTQEDSVTIRNHLDEHCPSR